MQNRQEYARKLRGFGKVDDEERAARWALWQLDGLGYRRIARLLDETGAHLIQVFEMDRQDLRHLLEQANLSKPLVERVCARADGACPTASFEQELDALPEHTRILHLGEPDYPSRLLDLDEPPVFLYVRGSIQWLSHLKTAAIVGSRKATVEGVGLARSVARDLAKAGVVCVSGGALGVDAAAHRGCLEGGTPTVSILAGGVDRPTPRRNAQVFDAIISHGAIVSEYPLGTRPRRFHFHRRNELIAAIGDTTLVVRAAEQSGTMITARAARTLERPLCALPGALDDPLAQGCHKLLVEGARCVRGAADILERVLSVSAASGQLSLDAATEHPELSDSGRISSASASRTPSRAARPQLSDACDRLLDALLELTEPDSAGVPLDQLKRHLDWPPARLNPALLELELVGAIAKRAGASVYEALVK